MPKWIIAGIVFVTVAAAGLMLFALQERGRSGAAGRQPAPRQQRIESQEGPKATIYAPENTANEAVIAKDPKTGEKIFEPRAGMDGYSIPEFHLVDQGGNPVDQSVFEGKVTILSFIFTHCITACPPMTANMLQIYNKLEGSPVQFISISVDPAHDTPDRLREYAGKFGIDTSRWRFLTGPDGEAQRVVNESLRFNISEDPDDSQAIVLEDGSRMPNIRHPIKLFLVGPDRRILDFCSHQVPADRERFAAFAREAAE